MTEKLLETAKMQIFHHSEHQMLEIIMSHDFEEVDIFKQDLQDFLKIVYQVKPQKNIWDIRNLQIVLDEQLQTWIDENINSKEVEAGVRAEAFLVNPSDLITELSIEQVMSEEFGSHIITRMFSDRAQAFDWITSC